MIFLVDSVSTDMADAFNSLLKPYKSSSPNFDLLSISLYQSGIGDSQQPAEAVFRYHEADGDRRKAEFERFMDPVDAMTKNDGKDCNLLHLLNRVYNQVSDTSISYHIYISSKMAENSAGAYDPSADNDNQVNGHYQFVNGDGEVNSSEIVQANKHLQDTTSWIYRHLVEIKKQNPQILHCKVFTTIYKQPQTANGTQKHTAGSGKDDLDVKNFWINLFNKMGLPYQITEATFDLADAKELVINGKP